MKTRFATTVVISVLLSCLGSFQASACGYFVKRAEINQRMADPGLDSGVREEAKALEAGAAAAIAAKYYKEGNQLYVSLMELLGIPVPSTKYRC